jgi:CspA family cold shock protein
MRLDRGFGFITSDEGSDVFFYRTAVDGQFSELIVGEPVSFEVEDTPKGPRATNVKSFSGGRAMVE